MSDQWKTKNLGTEFVDPDVERRYHDYMVGRYLREEVPTLKKAVGLLVASLIALPVIVGNYTPYFYLGFLFMLLPLLYGIASKSLGRFGRSLYARMALVPIGTLAAACWNHDLYLRGRSGEAAMAVFFVFLAVTITISLTARLRMLVNTLSVAIILTTSALFPSLNSVFAAWIVIGIACTAIMTLLGIRRDQVNRELFAATQQLTQVNEKVKTILYDVMPEKIANRLLTRPNEAVIERLPDTSVLFADLVGFTGMTRNVSPKELSDTLGTIFSRFDMLCEMTGVVKIKTIGDAYMCAAGVPEQNPDHLRRIANMALEMREAMVRYRKMSGKSLHLRIGINTGPVVAGMLGRSRFMYDLWGDTVNVASRLEGVAQIDGIATTRAVADQLAAYFAFESQGHLQVKGIGSVEVMKLVGPKKAGVNDETADLATGKSAA